jgi:hypothetical protein
MKKKNVQKIAMTFVLTMAMVLGPLPLPGFSVEVKADTDKTITGHFIPLFFMNSIRIILIGV